MTTRFQEFFASFTFMPRTTCVSPWWSLVVFGFRLGVCRKGAMVSSEVTRNSMWIPILWVTSSESKPVLLGTHRKNAQSFWMTQVNPPIGGGDWCSMYLGNCLLCGHLVLCSRNEPKKQSKAFAFGTGTSRRRDKTNKDPVWRHRCGILRANEQSKWSYWFGGTPKRQVWDACRIMLYDAVGVSSQSWLFHVLSRFCAFFMLWWTFGRFHHTYTSTMTHLYLLFDVRSSTNIFFLSTPKNRVLVLYRQFYSLNIVQYLHHWPPGFVPLGLFIAFLWHLGSLAKGASALALLRLLRWLLYLVHLAVAREQECNMVRVWWGGLFKETGIQVHLEMVLVNHCLILSNAGRWRSTAPNSLQPP